MQRICGFGARSFSGQDVVTVGLVDHDDIGHLHYAALDALQFIPCSSERDEHQEVDHARDSSFGLADAHRFDKDVSVSSRLTQQNRIAGILRYTAMSTARWRGPDESHFAGGKKSHARLVAEDTSPAELAAGIDGEYRDFLTAFADQMLSESFDQAALACAGDSGHSYPDRISAGRQALFEDLIGDLAVSWHGSFRSE